MPKTHPNYTILPRTKENLTVGTDQFALNSTYSPHLQIGFPIVHDLGILVALLPDDKMPPEGFGLTELNPFATVRRYEEGQIPLTTEEIETSLSIAQKVADWAKANTRE